jgi:transcriptional regulator with XRE-family HTH domain
MQDALKNNTARLISTLGAIVRQHRKIQHKTIYGISAEASMSKSTWREAELGVCKDMNISTLWKIAEGLDMTPAELVQELQEHLGADFSLTGLK